MFFLNLKENCSLEVTSLKIVAVLNWILLPPTSHKEIPPPRFAFENVFGRKTKKNKNLCQYKKSKIQVE